MSSDKYLPSAATHFDNPESTKSFVLGGQILLGSTIVLICVVVLMVALHLYARWYILRARCRQLVRRRNRLIEARRTSQIVFYVGDNPSTIIIADPGNRGLDSSVLRSLPVFDYSVITQPESMDCAVCLSVFEEGEKGRLLPKCNHAFHIECIDMWFSSHATCPLCRSSVEPVTEPEMNVCCLSQVGRTGVEPTGSNSVLFELCHNEEVNSLTTTLSSRRNSDGFRCDNRGAK